MRAFVHGTRGSAGIPWRTGIATGRLPDCEAYSVLRFNALRPDAENRYPTKGFLDQIKGNTHA